MVLCIVVGCGTKTGNKDGIGMFRIPSVIKNQGEQMEELTTTRQERWISAISRGDTEYKDILQSERVCGRHFASGSPAKHWDKHNVDWFPTLNLGKKEYRERNPKLAQERAERAKARRKSAIERQELEAAAKRKRVNEGGTRIASLDFSENTEGTSDQNADAANVEMEPKDGSSDFASQTFESHQSENVASTSGISAETQTEAFDHLYRKTNNHELPDVDAETQTQAFDYLFRKSIDSRAPDRVDAESQTEEFDYLIPTRSGYQAPDREFFLADERVRFYTGLPSYEILLVMFEQLAPHVSRRTQTLNKFQEFVMVLMKLRLNMPFQDLAYRFAISIATVSRIFSAWIVVMDAKLFPLVYWPEREQLWHTMPMCFQFAFGKKVTIIIDCFEVFIERPTNLLARAQTFSSYKHHNTIKILIGITLQGSISYVFETWGGRTSDKFLTENCGFLEHLLPGDMVMADRGFTITESVGLKQAKLVIPAFTKGKTQLDPVDVEKTRGIASVRIHVERVIGLLRRKYTILEGTLPTDFLACNPHGPPYAQVPMIDHIVRVCAALVNVCPPIVPFD